MTDQSTATQDDLAVAIAGYQLATHNMQLAGYAAIDARAAVRNMETVVAGFLGVYDDDEPTDFAKLQDLVRRLGDLRAIAATAEARVQTTTDGVTEIRRILVQALPADYRACL